MRFLSAKNLRYFGKLGGKKKTFLFRPRSAVRWKNLAIRFDTGFSGSW